MGKKETPSDDEVLQAFRACKDLDEEEAGRMAPEIMGGCLAAIQIFVFVLAVLASVRFCAVPVDVGFIMLCFSSPASPLRSVVLAMVIMVAALAPLDARLSSL